MAWRLLCAALLAMALCAPCYGVVCPTTQDACQKNPLCIWNVDGMGCTSALPCVLENTHQDCSDNTWRCTWSGGKCFKQSRRTDGDGCSTLTEEQCSTRLKCRWRDNVCERRPTVIISMPDDLGYYDVGWRNPRSRTPVIDAMRLKGVELDRFYTNRLCAPSRAMFFTGRPSWKLGLQTDYNMRRVRSTRCVTGPNVKLLPQYMKELGGYATHGVGKWHLGHFQTNMVPRQRGFDSFIGFYNGEVSNHEGPLKWKSQECACPPAPGSTSYKAVCSLFDSSITGVCATSNGMVNLTADGQSLVVDPQAQNDDSTDLFFARMVTDTIMRTPATDPLFMYIGWAASHSTLAAPERIQQTMSRAMPSYGTDSVMYTICPSDNRQTHLAMVSTMDEAHRMVIDALDESNRFDSTIFVFITDNGGYTPALKGYFDCGAGVNYPLRGAKYTWFEGGIRGTAFVTSPNFISAQRRNTTIPQLLSMNDWLITLSSAASLRQETILRNGDVDQWQILSGRQDTAARKNLILQAWFETRQYVVLFMFQESLWKLIVGSPYTQQTMANLGTPPPRYFHSEIYQPWELPQSELVWRVDMGHNRRYACRPYCLFNLSNDPQEFRVLTNTKGYEAANKEARRWMVRARKSGRAARRSNLCVLGWRQLSKKTLTDAYSMLLARSCGAFLPWVEPNGTYVALCDDTKST